MLLSREPVPVIRQLAEWLEIHRLRCGNPESGPIFANSAGRPMNLNNLLGRVILPAPHKAGIEWPGWHACRRGLGSNLYRLGVPNMVIQRILQHSNVDTTNTYYIEPIGDDVRSAMERLEGNLDAKWTPASVAIMPN